MSHDLAYKANAAEAAERLAMLWSRQGRDRIFAHFPMPSRAIASFAASHTDGQTDCPDPNEIAGLWDAHFAELAALEDDWLPYGYVNEFDQGIYAAATLGAPMQYMMNAAEGRVSSMAPASLHDMTDVAKLRIDPGSEVIRLLDRHLEVYARHSRGKFGISPFIVLDAMNFVSEIRGATRSFEDTFDYPDETEQLMDFALEFAIFIQERVLDAIDSYHGGSFTLTGSWAPGKAVSFSVDAYHLASPDFYYRWGEPHLQRLLDHFDGGALHLHGNGRHLLPHVRKLRKLLCIQMGSEPWSVPAHELLDQFQEQAGGVPLIVSYPLAEFEQALESKALPGNVLYVVGGVGSIGEANRLAERVRAYRR